jgi:hypothetical protein
MLLRLTTLSQQYELYGVEFEGNYEWLIRNDVEEYSPIDFKKLPQNLFVRTDEK